MRPGMVILKTFLFIVLAVVALTVVGKVRQRVAAGAPATARDSGLSAAGFYPLKPEDAKNSRVTIMSPPNCPSADAVRARALESSLRSAGIPCELKQGIEFQFTDPAEAGRVTKFMEQVANPLVLVRGWAKGNPSPQDVIAQYQSGK